MCVTSPPYYGLRDYGTATWEGGDPECSHQRDTKVTSSCTTGHSAMDSAVGDAIYKKECKKCGAKRIDSQIGLEETPEEYIENMVEVFRGVRDILADDGVIWVNIGDSYYNYRPGNLSYTKQSIASNNQDLPEISAKRNTKLDGYKEKDLIGIPWMLAFALRADGWYLRQDIIWSKVNPMPESVRDRCTKSHEYIFLLSKSKNYYFDHEAIKEPVAAASKARMQRGVSDHHKNINGAPGQTPHTIINQPRANGEITETSDLRNKRSVWTVAIKPYKGAHFATYPEELIEPCILSSSRKGDIVFDPFMGSGTTAMVATKLGRQYLGTELNPEYAELQQERINSVSSYVAFNSLFDEVDNE